MSSANRLFFQLNNRSKYFLVISLVLDISIDGFICLHLLILIFFFKFLSEFVIFPLIVYAIILYTPNQSDLFSMDVYLFASFGIIGKTIRLLNWFLIAAPVIPLHWENCDLQKPFLTAASNLSKTKTSQELCVVLFFFQQLWLNWIPSLVLTFEQLREILSCVGLTCLGDQELAN